MANVAVAVLGLGRVGASIGLALERYNKEDKDHTFSVTGYDTSADKVKAVQNLGAMSKTTNRLGEAVKGKDIVIIDLA